MKLVNDILKTNLTVLDPEFNSLRKTLLKDNADRRIIKIIEPHRSKKFQVIWKDKTSLIGRFNIVINAFNKQDAVKQVKDRFFGKNDKLQIVIPLKESK